MSARKSNAVPSSETRIDVQVYLNSGLLFDAAYYGEKLERMDSIAVLPRNARCVMCDKTIKQMLSERCDTTGGHTVRLWADGTVMKQNWTKKK